MWQLIGNLSSIATIIGVSVTNLISDKWKSWIALAAVLLCLLYLAWKARNAFDAFSKQHYPRGYLPLSAFARFTTADGCRVTYENFRHIQIKTAYRKAIDHRFTWSGTKDPVVRSDLQTVSSIRPVPGEKTREVTLTFRRVRMFNDVEILHTCMEIDDSDGKSEPFVSLRVEHPLRLLNFRVELLHANKTQNARAAVFSRTPIDNPAATPEELGIVQFNAVTRSYSHQITDPDPGWVYKLSWIKPNGQRRGQPKK